MTEALARPTTGSTQLTLERMGPSFGAHAVGIDLRHLTDEAVVAIRAALVEHKVLFFRGQDLTDADQIELGRRLGEVTAGHPVARSEAVNQPEIYDIDSTDPEFSFSDVWHTDVTFMEKPPLGSILRAVRLPAYGGDTSWADSQRAYESLSEPVRRLVDGLTAVHDGEQEWGAYLRRRENRGNIWDGKQVNALTPVEHPVVRVHPESGRKGLFVNPGFTSHIVGVSDAESRALLDLLYAHLTKPEHIIRHRWQLGDVGIWDNRSTAHYANRDYSQARVMRRITLAGDRPVGPGPTS
jgi:alpha-ketoglutarate-dependent taurine dioxygenase